MDKDRAIEYMKNYEGLKELQAIGALLIAILEQLEDANNDR